MPPGFPPKTSFPIAIDSDRTLFLVYNTSEARTVADASAWAEEISIEPVGDYDREIWAENGFANISGELFYYDAVERTEVPGAGFLKGSVKVDGNGKITSISVAEGGSGYAMPTVVITEPAGSGAGAKAEAVVKNGAISSIKIVNGGLGYDPSKVQVAFLGKVRKLKRCLRNLGGKRTKFNERGTWVRGFIIAEHHNQLVDAVVATEGYIYDLEDEIGLLESEPFCPDDSYCVSVLFDTKISQSVGDPCGGATMEYTIQIVGTFSSFTLDFGDGQSTNSAQSGTHTYAPGATIDPVITVVSDNCTVIQTPTNRSEGKIPEGQTVTIPRLPIPQVPAFPNLAIPTFDLNEVPVELPQIIFPCLDVAPISQTPISVILVPPTISISPPQFGPIPVVISPSFSFGPVIPSTITFVNNPPVLPSTITFINPPPVLPPTIEFINPPPPLPDTITFEGAPNIPDIINFGAAPTLGPVYFDTNFDFPLVNFNYQAVTFPKIEFAPINISNIKASITWGNPPMVSVYWGPSPRISVVVTVECGSSTTSGSGSSAFRRTLDDSFVDDFNAEDFEVEIGDLGIPSEIKVVAPKFPELKVKHDIPEFINVISDLPNKIIMYQADVLPNEIRIVSEDVPKSIALDASEVPKSIRIDAEGVPGAISLVNVDVPSVIRVDGSEIPDVIKVVGIPDSIEVRMPSEIVAKLEIPENLEIPLVYKGGPVPVQFDTSNLIGGDDQACFALVPCNKK